eukprot:1171495-Rhodomonas_salina.2
MPYLCSLVPDHAGLRLVLQYAYERGLQYAFPSQRYAFESRVPAQLEIKAGNHIMILSSVLHDTCAFSYEKCVFCFVLYLISPRAEIQDWARVLGKNAARSKTRNRFPGTICPEIVGLGFDFGGHCWA